LFHSRKEAEQQPAVNLQIARAYLAASDPQITTRDWQFVMDELVKLKKDQTQHRWQTAIKDKAFDSIRHLPLLETRPEHFLRVLEAGKVSSNACLRRIHNFALDMTWLPWPLIPKRQWPAVQYKEKRAITAGDLTNILYSDSITPGVTNSYDRIGRLKSVVCNGMTDTLSHNLANELVSESFSGDPLDNLSVTNGFDADLRRTVLCTLASSSPLSTTT
jgi:hypothetical protein